MKTRVLSILIILVLIFGFSGIGSVFAIDHPHAKVYGFVTKDIKIDPAATIWTYGFGEGEVSKNLPFNMSDGQTINSIAYPANYTFYTSQVVFTKELENNSVATTIDESAAFVNTPTTSAQLLSSNGLDYILLRFTTTLANTTTATDANKAWKFGVKDAVDEPISSDTYIIFTAKQEISGLSLGSGLDRNFALLRLIVVDTGGVQHFISVSIGKKLASDAQGIGYSSSTTFDGITTDNVAYGYTTTTAQESDPYYTTLQLKIGDMLAGAGVSWVPSKVTTIYYILTGDLSAVVYDGDTLDVAAYIRHAFLSSQEVKIDNNFFNATQITLSSEKPTISGVSAEWIRNVKIPFMYEPGFEADTDADNTAIAYRWVYQLPDHAELSYSDTQLVLSLNKDGDSIDYAYYNGQDFLSDLIGLKAGDTYVIASGLVAGNYYEVKIKVNYLPEEFDALTSEPLFWSNPVAWIQYKFWQLLIAIASFLGLGTAWARRKQRGLRRVRR